MQLAEILFWIGLFIIFYSFAGYGILLGILIAIKRIIKGIPSPPKSQPDDLLPEVTFIVAAYNEADWIEAKIKNNLTFDYPPEKLHLFFVTDGSNDDTPKLIDLYPYPSGTNVRLFHEDGRKGKIAAVERIMPFVKSPVTIYTDANTMVNPKAIKNIVRHYQDESVGAVAGEKRISLQEKDAANAAGEGIYWKYESKLKQWDSELYSVVGAAGELFSIRTELFTPVPPDTIIEDFFMTLGIAKRGYRVIYEPEAYAVESSSASVQEELKRKVRIAAGGLQAISRLTPLLNPFVYGTLSFQYISHRVLRWTLAPLLLPIVFLLNLYLAWQGLIAYQLLMILQVLFYGAAIVGYLLEKRKLKFKAFFIPYYFVIMNYAVYKGFGRFVRGRQSVVWEKAKRATSNS